ERQETVLTRERELRVDPLDLDHAADVGVDVETAVGVDLTAGGSCTRAPAGCAGREAARGPADVAREAAVVGPGLPIRQVDLETQNRPDPPAPQPHAPP